MYFQGSIVYELLPMGNGIGYFTLLSNGVLETTRSFNMSQRNVFNYQVKYYNYVHVYHLTMYKRSKHCF